MRKPNLFRILITNKNKYICNLKQNDIPLINIKTLKTNFYIYDDVFIIIIRSILQALQPKYARKLI